MPLEEVILCSTAPSTSASGPGTISLHNIQTGTTLATFKQTTTNSHNTAVVQTKDGQGGFMLAAQADKSIMNVYNFQKVLTPCSLKSYSLSDYRIKWHSKLSYQRNCPVLPSTPKGGTVLEERRKDVSTCGRLVSLYCVKYPNFTSDMLQK